MGKAAVTIVCQAAIAAAAATTAWSGAAASSPTKEEKQDKHRETDKQVDRQMVFPDEATEKQTTGSSTVGVSGAEAP